MDTLVGKSISSLWIIAILRLVLEPTSTYLDEMTAIGTNIDETGTLLREGAAFVLRRDAGGRWILDMHRVPVDHVEKRVRITGTVVGDGLVDVNSLTGQI